MYYPVDRDSLLQSSKSLSRGKMSAIAEEEDPFQSAKTRANDKFREGLFDEAIELYTAALDVAESGLWMCYSKLFLEVSCFQAAIMKTTLQGHDAA